MCCTSKWDLPARVTRVRGPPVARPRVPRPPDFEERPPNYKSNIAAAPGRGSRLVTSKRGNRDREGERYPGGQGIYANEMSR